MNYSNLIFQRNTLPDAVFPRLALRDAYQFSKFSEGRLPKLVKIHDSSFSAHDTIIERTVTLKSFDLMIMLSWVLLCCNSRKTTLSDSSKVMSVHLIKCLISRQSHCLNLTPLHLPSCSNLQVSWKGLLCHLRYCLSLHSALSLC